MTWLHKTRLKVLAYAAGVLLAAIGLVSLTTMPAWPVLGVAVAAVVVVINRAAGRLNQHTCFGCGNDTGKLPAGDYGVNCPACGMFSQRIGGIADSADKAERQGS